MSKAPTDPIRPTDAEARALALSLLRSARHAALATLAPDGFPMVTRIAIRLDAEGVPLACLSGLAAHSAALNADPRASLLLGEPGEKGDPLTHPRLTLQALAEQAAQGERPALAALWRKQHPKSAVYLDLPDFRFVRFRPQAALLNGGFGRAWRLAAEDLRGGVPGPGG